MSERAERHADAAEHAAEPTGADRHGAVAPSLPAALTVAAMASIAAGLVHAAAAGSHGGDGALPLLFALAAAAQVGWAAAVVWSPVPAVVAGGIALHGALVVVWALTRTIGWGVVDALAAPSPVTGQDLTAAALAIVALGGSALTLAAWLAPAWTGRRIAPVVAGVVLIGLAVPAMTADHDHGHDHGDEVLAVGSDASHDHDHGSGADERLDLDPVADHADHGDHGDHDGEPTGPVISVDDPRLSDEQRAAAEDLIARTRTAMARYSDVASVEAAGYLSIGDSGTGWEHFVHPGHIADPTILDPERVESIVFRVDPDGTRTLVSAMYILPPGQTMADVPDIAGELTVWHDHQDLCWEGLRVVGRIDADGNCPRGEFRPTAPMLHVWLVEHECGPFAGIEGGHGSGCEHDHGPTAADSASPSAGRGAEAAAG